MSSLGSILILIILCFLLVESVPVVQCGIYTEEQTNAIDAAVQTLINDESFKNFYRDMLYFSVPPCTPTSGTNYRKVDYPKVNPFTDRSSIVLCMETGAIYPLLDVKLRVGESIVSNINSKYSTSLKAEWKFYNTSQFGFFPTMRNAVNNKECDIVSSNTTPLPERVLVAHFQCAYGTTTFGYIKSNRKGLVVNTPLDLNQTGIVVGSLDSTTYSSYIKTYLSAATFKPFKNYADQFPSINNGEVDAIIGDAVQYFIWLKANNATCGCEAKAFGDPYYFGTFTTNNYTLSGAISLGQNFLFKSILVCLSSLFALLVL